MKNVKTTATATLLKSHTSLYCKSHHCIFLSATTACRLSPTKHTGVEYRSDFKENNINMY